MPERGRSIRTSTARAPSQTSSAYTVQQGDAFVVLPALPPESVDLVITDFPYESLEKYRKVGTTTRLKKSKASSNEWFPVVPDVRIPELLQMLYRVLKPNTHCYMFTDQITLPVVKAAAEATGFRWWKFLVWDKERIGMGYHYRCRHELIAFMEKGRRALRDLSVPDVLAFKPPWRKYPTEKPQALMDVLVRQSAVPGNLVLDPFCGAGASGAAALDHGCRFTGYDINPAAAALTAGRLGRKVDTGS